MQKAVTYTDEHNAPLQRLFQQHGYTMKTMKNGFVQLCKRLLDQ